MHEETVGCNTTDTVTQEWMEAFDARIAENVKHYHKTRYGNTVLVSEKRIGGKPIPIRPPEPPTVWGKPTGYIHPSSTQGGVSGLAIGMAVVVIFTIIMLMIVL